MPALGTAFQVRGSGFHIWIVISAPFNGNVLVVNATDERQNQDWTCRLGPADYTVLTKPSVIFYKKAEAWNAAKIDAELLSEVRLRRLPDCPLILVTRIIAGAQLSNEFTPRLLAYLK